MRSQILNKSRADFDILCDCFIEDGVFSQFNMPLITIYQETSDFPGQFVARLFNIEPGKAITTRYIMLADDLDSLRQKVPAHMTRFLPSPSDDPVVLESWI